MNIGFTINYFPNTHNSAVAQTSQPLFSSQSNYMNKIPGMPPWLNILCGIMFRDIYLDIYTRLYGNKNILLIYLLQDMMGILSTVNLSHTK